MAENTLDENITHEEAELFMPVFRSISRRLYESLTASWHNVGVTVDTKHDPETKKVHVTHLVEINSLK